MVKLPALLKETLCISLFLFSVFVRAQTEVPAGAFVKLNNDSVLLGRSVIYSENVLKSSTVDLDNRIIKSKYLNYFGIGPDYFYARVPGKGLMEATFKKKNIYFFKVVKKGGSAPSHGHGGANPVGPSGGYSTSINYYYTVGLTGVKKMFITNLKKDLTDDPATVTIINEGMKYRKISQLCFLTGILANFATIALLVAPDSGVFNSANRLTSGLFMISYGASILFYHKKWKTKEKAVTQYAGIWY
jgi:hypothetical protein